MAVSLIVVVAMLGRTTVWVESADATVFPDSRPGITAAESARIYAGRGERESFQVCIRAGKKALSGVELRAEALDKEIGPPVARRVGYLRVDAASAAAETKPRPVWPDPLLDYEPFDVPPGETRAFWVTYEVPRKVKAGLHSGAVELVFGKSLKRTIPVTIEVFDLEIPETPTLRSLFPLDRRAIRGFYGIGDESLSTWKPIYDALASFRISFSLWTDAGLAPVGPSGKVDSTAFKEHLDYLLTAVHVNTADLGMGERGILPFMEASPGGATHALSAYVGDLANWLQERGQLDKASIQAMPLSERDAWPEARALFAKLQQAEPRLPRLVIAPLHPYFERYADLWAIPLSANDPFAVERLKAGLSLANPLAHPAIAVTASTAGTLPGPPGPASLPSDAYDGCLYTAWCSASAPSPKKREWLQLDFPAPVPLSELTVVWQPGLESESLTLETSFDGTRFQQARTRWEHRAALGPFQPGWSKGVLAVPKPALGLRLGFGGSVNAGPVGIREVALGARNATPEAQVQPPELWLSVEQDTFPSFDAGSMLARAIPWLCWRYGFSGFVYPSLNRWPPAWKPRFASAPLEWEGGGHGETFLVYPGPRGLIPSLRGELLRDGLEDYEYLAALHKVVEEGRVPDSRVKALCEPQPAARVPSGAAREKWLAEIPKVRVQIGRELTRLAKEKKK